MYRRIREPLFAFFAILVFSVFSPFVLAADANSLDPYFKNVLGPCETFNMKGGVFNTSNSSQALGGFNVSINVSGTGFNSQFSNMSNASTGLFVNVSIPCGASGSYNITVYDNSSYNHTKIIPIYVTNATNASLLFSVTKPPFAAGTNFTVNVTFTNVSGSAVASLNAPLLEVFAANGQRQSWTVRNLTNVTNANGMIQYNVTIPSNADGQYVLVAEKGAGFTIFIVKSSYNIAVLPQNSAGDNKIDFAPTDSVQIMVKLRDASNNPVSSITSAVAYVLLPNNTMVSVTLSAPNASVLPGFFNGTFNASLTGDHQIKAIVNISGTLVTGYAFFLTKRFAAKLEEVRTGGFFREWGGKSAIQPGGMVALNLIMSNLTDGSIIAANSTFAGGASGFNCSSINGGTNASTANVTLAFAASPSVETQYSTASSVVTYQSTTICRITFTAPATAGVYIAKLNTTYAGSTVAARGFITVQEYILNVRPVASYGGNEFMMSFSPGDSATFSISAFNLTGGTIVAGNKITAPTTVVRMTSLESRGSEITNVAYTFNPGSEPTLTVTLPSTLTGPISVEVQANISNGSEAGQFVKGTAMVMSKYVEGFLFPQSTSGGMAGASSGGPGGESGGGPGGMEGKMGNSACSGTQGFSGFAKDVKSNSGAQGLSLNNIIEAREERTGKEITGCLTLSKTTSTSAGNSSSGNLNFNVTFANNASCSYSGFYFMLVNVSYQGKTDALPGAFQCRRFSFWPQVLTSSGQNSWQISSNAVLNVTVSNVKLLGPGNHNISSGTVTIISADSFNPASGPTFLQVRNPLNATLIDGSANLTVSFANFSTSVGGPALSKWPNGFVSMMVQVCNVTGNVCDAEEAGFQIVGFTAYPQMYGSTPQAYPGANISVIIMAQTNVAQINGANTSGFTIRIGRPWEGQVTTVSGADVITTLMTDGWNSSADSFNYSMGMGYEQWNVTFMVPSSITTRGFTPAIITVNNSQNDNTEVFYSLTFSKFSVSIPSEDGLQLFNGGANFVDFNNVEAMQAMGFDPRYFNGSAGSIGINGSNMTSRSGRVCGTNSSSVTIQRYGGPDSGSSINELGNAKLLILDRNTSTSDGSYDTILVNRSTSANTSELIFANATRRIIWTGPNGGGLYLWNVYDCSYVSLVNATAASAAAASGMSNNWGGDEHQVNVSFSIPFLVKRGAERISGASVSAKSIVKQNDMGGGSSMSGGIGIESSLVLGTNYTVLNTTTDASGIGFVTVTMLNSGQFMLFWNATAGSDTDTAGFDSGVFFGARYFRVEGSPIYSIQSRAVSNLTLTYVNSTPVSIMCDGALTMACWNTTAFAIRNVTIPGTQLFIGMLNESVAGQKFTNDALNQSWYFAYDNATGILKIHNRTDFAIGTLATDSLNGSFSSLAGSQNLLTHMNYNIEMQVAQATNTSASTYAISFYQLSPSPNQYGGGFISPAASDSPIYARACATQFGKAHTVIPNVNVSIKMQQWGMSGRTTTNLNVVDPITGATTQSVLAGARGCAALKILAPAGGWPASSGFSGPAELRSSIINGSSSEEGWVGMVQYGTFSPSFGG